MFYSNFMSQYSPFGGNTSQSNVSLSSPWATYPGGNPIPALSANNGLGHADPNGAFPSLGTYVTFPLSNYHAPYVNQWNLSVQRQVGKDWLLTANYIGNSQIHMTTSNLLNPAVYLGLGACTLNGAPQATCSTTANQQNRRVESLLNPTLGPILRRNRLRRRRRHHHLRRAVPVRSEAAQPRREHHDQLHLVALHWRHSRSADQRRRAWPIFPAIAGQAAGIA